MEQAKKFYEENKENIKLYQELKEKLESLAYDDKEYEKMLIEKTVDMILVDYPNLSINYSDLNGLDSFGDIYKMCKEKYIDNANSLALSQIKKRAQDFLQCIGWEEKEKREQNNEPAYKVTDIYQDNGKITLRVYVDKDYNGKSRLSYGERPSFSKLEKYIFIVLEGGNPVNVNSGEIANFYWDNKFNSDHLFEKYQVGKGTVEWTQLYKNGKFIVKFREEKDAGKFAEALIR